ncbi:DNA polymerase III subunit beta [Porphyromonas loveana]|uniref:Beta sliding clamp n=2 Tax=Porphyromonas loveana TaxID=1884669 RepID=A0A2U1F829_9PORP|nr:DNA polymerase III subunit beta [Porphyromonas loveana]PVZ08316.1 DNA polymerase III beta subunit [Porphyromonas loveana]
MKFEVASNMMLQHLQLIARVIASRSTLPILESVLFELEGDKLRLTAADMANRMSTELTVNNIGGENGTFAVPERILLEPLKELPDQPIAFEVNTDSKAAQIAYSNGHYTFVVQDASTYPQAAALSQDAITSVLPAESLMSGLSATLFATSQDERRPIMTGVYMDFFEDKLVFVGSDGQILVKQEDANVRSSQRSAFCLPRKACLLLRSVLPKLEGNVQLTYDNNYLHIELGDYTLTARLLEGRYPNYNSVIPTSNPYEVKVDRLQLLSGAKRVAIFSNPATSMLRMEFTPDGIRLSANDIDFSVAAEEHVAADCPADMNMRIGFKSDVFQTILQGMSSDEVIITLADQTRAGLILPAENEPGISLCNLLLPMKLIGE